MEEKAVIDRFEGAQAVLLVGDNERQVVIPRKSLPKEAKEGKWLKVELDGEKMVSAVIDEEKTARARQRIMEKLTRLRKNEHLG